jgi:hypothetical protein
MIGTAMAQMALSGLAGHERPDGLFLLDAETMNWRRLKTPRNADCPDCGA